METSVAKYVRMNYHNAVSMVEECIKDLVKGFDKKGLELNVHNEGVDYAVISEISPNDFKVVEKIRCFNNKLEMQLENEEKWRELAFVDVGYLLDEVLHALEMEN